MVAGEAGWRGEAALRDLVSDGQLATGALLPPFAASGMVLGFVMLFRAKARRRRHTVKSRVGHGKVSPTANPASRYGTTGTEVRSAANALAATARPMTFPASLSKR